VVDRYIENAGGLAQANLPLSGALILAEWDGYGGRKKKRAEFLCPLLMYLARRARVLS